MSARAAAVGIAALVSVLGGCSDAPDAELGTAVASPVAAVTAGEATVTFPRTLQADRLVEAQVRTTRDADVVVIAAQLDSPLFVDSPERESTVRLFADWDNRVRLPLGAPECGQSEPGGQSHVVLRLTVNGKQKVETLRVVDDAKLREIRDAECAQQAVLDVAEPSFGSVESQTAETMMTSIVLTRGDVDTDAPVTITAMTGNIVFIIELADEPRTLAPGQASLSVPAVVRVGRCDPHVFAESKKTFVFPVHLAIGDAEPSYVEIQPDPVTREALQQLFVSCGEAQREGDG